jgi:hypothetical protein
LAAKLTQVRTNKDIAVNLGKLIRVKPRLEFSEQNQSNSIMEDGEIRGRNYCRLLLEKSGYTVLG